MVKSGTVISLDRASNTGVIETKRGQEFFFSISECEGNELPALYSLVTFVKDPAYKATDVAMLIMLSPVQLVG